MRVDNKSLDTIAREFARNTGEIIEPDDERGSSAIMQSVFSGRNALLIFDNAEAPDIRQLIPGGRCGVIITTRDRGLSVLLDVPRVARIEVPVLSMDRSLDLLRTRLGTRVDAELDAARRIVTLVGGLPLALQIVAAILEIQSWRRLSDFADILKKERDRLAKLAIRGDPHLDVRVSFSASLKLLQPEEIDFFACLGICHPDGFGLHSASAAANAEIPFAEERLGYLYRLSLVNHPEGMEGIRFVLHPLLRLFALELAEECHLTDAAAERYARHFIALVKATAEEESEKSPLMADEIGEAVVAAEWLLVNRETDYEYLIRLEPLLHRHGFWKEAAGLMGRFLLIAEELADTNAVVQLRIQDAKFLQLQGHLQSSLEMLQPAVDSLQLTGLQDTRIGAMLFNTYGGVLQRLGRFEEAAEALKRSYELSVDQNDERGQAMVLNSLGGVLQRLSRFEEAAEALKRSYELLVDQKDERGQAMVLNSLGGVLQRLSQFEEAAEALGKSGEIDERLGNERGRAMVFNSLGGVLQRLGRFDEAAEALRKSEEIEERLGNERGQAMVLNSLGGVLQRLGKEDDAESAFLISIAMGEKLNDFLHMAKVRTAFGKALVSRGNLNRAVEQLRIGFGLDEQAGNKRGLAIVTPILVQALRQIGADEEAYKIISRALQVAPYENKIRRLNESLSSEEAVASAPATLVAARVKRLLEPLGRPRYGFIVSDGYDRDIYFSEKRIGVALFSQLQEQATVEAKVISTPRGWEALEMRLV